MKERATYKTGVGGKIISKWVLKNRLGVCVRDSSDSGQGQVLGFCEHGNDLLVP
jgi:hypothetical protein